MKKYFSLKSLFRGAIQLQMVLGAQVLTVNFARLGAGDSWTRELQAIIFPSFKNSRKKKLEKQKPKEPQNPPMNQEMMDYQRKQHGGCLWYSTARGLYYDKKWRNGDENFTNKKWMPTCPHVEPYEQMESKQISRNKKKKCLKSVLAKLIIYLSEHVWVSSMVLFWRGSCDLI